MVIRRSHCNCRQLGIDQKASSPQGNYLDQRKSLFGSSTDSELLGWLKRVALDPCTPEVLVRKLRNQTLTIRKVLSLSSAEFPQQRKRKFQLFPGSGKFTTTLEFASERLNDQNAKQLAIVHSSSTSLVDSTECASAKKFLNSCSSYSILTSDDNFQKKVQLCFNFDNKNEGAHFNPSNNNISFQGNMDESIDASHSDSKSLVIEDASSISMDSNELLPLIKGSPVIRRVLGGGAMMAEKGNAQKLKSLLGFVKAQLQKETDKYQKRME
ncbi:unnamed protein product [Dovyalis caffra]|uniref:Uncharacterized protein n=1 Tax=Dovyalis caffra TaxID=77055 RepID=A0AAV1RFE8_9ROSI|nr:unnamed protein product [Dovyalis caffra]